MLSSDEPLDLSRSAIEEQAKVCFAESDGHNYRSGQMLLAMLAEIERLRGEELEAKLRKAAEVMRKVEPYLDAIICYASTMDEHEPNRIAAEFRAFLATMEPSDPVTPPAVAPLGDDSKV